MDWAQLLWAAGGYLAGSLPSTLIVAKAKRATGLLAAAGRASGETDPHILMVRHLGVGWTVFAATMDVLKGFVYLLAAREWGPLEPAWLALAGVLVVVGHTYPFVGREMAGRGLAAAAGVYLVLLPVQMVIAGILIVLGSLARNTGLAATVGMLSVPLVAAVQGQPGPLVAMAAGIFLVLVVRRLEGVGAVVAGGVSPARAVLYRAVFDSSGPPPGRGVWQTRREDLPPP